MPYKGNFSVVVMTKAAKAENERLKEQNLELRERHKQLREKLDVLSKILKDPRKFDVLRERMHKYHQSSQNEHRVISSVHTALR